MTKEKQLTELTRTHTGRRRFLSLSILAGSSVLIADDCEAQTQPDNLPAEISVAADSIVLYTNLLEDLEDVVRSEKLKRIAYEKLVASGQLRKVFDKAVEFDRKYHEHPDVTVADRASDFDQLLTLIKATDVFRYRIEMMGKEDIPALINLPQLIEDIRSAMLAASRLLTDRKLDAARSKIREAIQMLANLAGPTGTNDGSSPAGRLILMLEGVQKSIDRMSALPAMQKRYGAAFGASDPRPAFVGFPMADVDQILRRHVIPGRWYQIVTGKVVAYPILYRTGDRGIREKLLNDALRLVPGLVPNALYEAAKELAALTI